MTQSANRPFLLTFVGCLFILWVLIASQAFGSGERKQAKDKEKPKHTNRLAKETSPYLLMHAHNPVDWYPWGSEAFAKAKKEGKLVFLSVGYSSCYWCHVMERESFNHPEVAKLLNKWFVCIKVDREERPDVDQVYMTALNVLGQNGGWPMSMFLTSDGRPIFGGTYWPREDREIDGKRYAGFMTILTRIHEIAEQKPKEVEVQAKQLAEATQRELDIASRGIAVFKPDRKLVNEAVDELKASFDKEYGGFGAPSRDFRGPKFPTPCRLNFLLQEGHRRKSQELIDMVLLTLDKMAHGGIYDHLGGGFHRYSTERTWTVPHFEKMLYDNAQLVEVYAKAYRLTNRPLYKRIIEETLAYVEREMMSPEGVFYSSQDAETEEEEGRSYVWTLDELKQAITNQDDLQLLCKVYGADGKPNFEDKYFILHLPRTIAETAATLKMTETQLMERLQPTKQRLFEVRQQREQPFLNKVALTAWSGLMVAGFAEAGDVLNNPKYAATAKRAAEFLLANQKANDGRLYRTYGGAPGQKPKADVNAYLEDYTCLVHGLLTLQRVTGEKKWLDEARVLTDVMIHQYGDEQIGGYYFTARDHEKLFARSKDQYDGAIPSGNSLAMVNLVKLWQLTNDTKYRREAERGFQAFSTRLRSFPTALPTMMQALSMHLDDTEKAK